MIDFFFFFITFYENSHLYQHPSYPVNCHTMVSVDADGMVIINGNILISSHERDEYYSQK